MHVGEGVLNAVLNGGDADAGGGPYSYVVDIGRRHAGTLSRERVPFEVEAAPRRPPGRLERTLRAVLPGKTGDAVFTRRPPLAWKLEVAGLHDVPERQRLLAPAAILAVEIALW
jgi:hypothetical protein